MAETRQFAAVHYFAMLDEESNGETRPNRDTRRSVLAVGCSAVLCRLTGNHAHSTELIGDEAANVMTVSIVVFLVA